ncbi:hypothetical protein DTO166G4_1174 [Paecilomyces variotii]|nr:hypothetical protein DTO166G4_1174 [Paecilomyces variotii]KAJ9242173.1 hypothetical protein DTO166G5_576 [Paecilomyces variotii]
MSLKTQSRREKVLSRGEIEQLIADGHQIVIFDRKVLKVDAWLQYHPGGDKAILHMVGKDATDEITMFHSDSAVHMMQRYQIGKVEERWVNFVPPIQGGTFRRRVEEKCESEVLKMKNESVQEGNTISRPQMIASDGIKANAKSLSKTSFLDIRTKQEIDLDLSRYPSVDPAKQDEVVRKFHKLHERVISEGLYDCSYRAYAIETCRYVLVALLFVLFLRLGWYNTSAVFLGMLWHLLVFTVHDAAHLAITHDYTTDSLIAFTIASFIGGLSASWWKRNHNIHHVVTNAPEHDPDIEHIPFFAISHRFFTSLRSTFYERVMTYDAAARVLIRVQHWMYYPILLFGRFNLYRLSWEHLLRGLGPRKGIAWWHRWYEMVGQIFFWAWFGYGILYKSIPTMWDRFAFLMVSHMVTMPLHVLFTVSHFAMSTADLGASESFPQKMLRTTMDVDCPEWLNFWYGGLQFQVIHHLFPRMPRHNLARAQKFVLEYCEDVGIPYAFYGILDSNKHVLSKLGDIAKQATILAECQKAAAEDILKAHY